MKRPTEAKPATKRLVSKSGDSVDHCFTAPFSTAEQMYPQGTEQGQLSVKHGIVSR